MNKAILAYLEDEKVALSEEQKAQVLAFDQQLEEYRMQAEVLQREKDEADLIRLVEDELERSGVENLRLAWALLDKEKLSLEDGEVKGLQEQISALKKEQETAFLFEKQENLPRFVSVGKVGRHREDAARSVMGLRK